MKLNEITDWDHLNIVLDRIFHKGQAEESSVKRLGQGFDPKKGEQIVNLQYRYRLQDQGPITQKPRKVKLRAEDDDENTKK